MESGGMKGGGWRRRSFPASVFSEGGGGRATRSGEGRGGGGGQQRQQQQQPILLRDAAKAIDSLSASEAAAAAAAAAAAGEDDLPGEDISLLDNRPVDQKMLRKRNQGHTQKMNLDDSNVQPSQISLTANNRFEANNARQPHRPKLRTEEEEEEEEDDDDDDVKDRNQHSSLSFSSSSSSFNSFLFKPKSKPGVRENRFNETESETADASFQQLPSRSDAMTSPYDVRVVVSTKRDVITIVDETLTSDVSSGGGGGDRTRHGDVTAMRAKEPELGNLIDFD